MRDLIIENKAIFVLDCKYAIAKLWPFHTGVSEYRLTLRSQPQVVT